MDYRKIDAPLAAALREIRDQEERALVVFINTEHPPDNAEIALLERLGVKGTTEPRKIFTATLSVHAIKELSDQPWVQYIKLSKKLRLLNER